MQGEYVRNTTPADLAVDLEDVKQDLRLDGSDDLDDQLQAHVQAATEEVESDCRRQLLEAEFTLYLDRFPRAADPHGLTLLVERCPVSSIDEIRYVDTAGVQQTLSAASYRADVVSEPARIDPAYGLTWPVTRAVSHAVEVDFTAGYGEPGDIPELAKQTIRARVRELFDGCSGDGSGVEALKQRLKWGAQWRN